MNNSRVCVYAFDRKNKNLNPNQFKIDIDVSVGSMASISHYPSPYFFVPQKSSRKTMEYPSNVFFQQCNMIISNILKDALQELLFDSISKDDKIYWGFSFRENNKASSNLDEIIAKVVETAYKCGKNNDNLEIGIEKICGDTESKEEKEPLKSWIAENLNDVRLHNAYRVIYKFNMESPLMGNKYLGLKSAEVKEEEKSCSICLFPLKKGKQCIKMPCSHIFHGFCILEWIDVKPICPLCRFDLYADHGRALES